MAVPSLIVLFFVYQTLNIKALILVLLTSFFIGGVFEIWAVKQGKKDKFYIWEYNPKTTLNKKIMGIAIEDMTLFLFLTPVFTIAVWEAAKKLLIVYDISFAWLLIGGPIFILTSYFLFFHMTKPNAKKKRR